MLKTNKTLSPQRNPGSSPWARKKNYALMLAIAGVSQAMFSGQVYAADDDTASAKVKASDEQKAKDAGGQTEELIVTGIRQTLMNAQSIKRDASTVVDSITSKDLGSFPDTSIAEALQRVAGITVNRFAATGDTAHFSAEPSGVVVRGLLQVRNEFNGRDTFSANSSRGLSWTDVSPELLAGADTYKNQTADMVEGGIAGTVNLRTRVPFDQDGLMAAVNVKEDFNDLAVKVTPEVSGLWSNRWDTDLGEFGFLANGAYSKVQTRSEGVQLYRINRFKDVFPGTSEAYVPAIINMRDNTYFRTRTGASLAGQWKSPDEHFLVTAQYNRSKYNNAWEEYVVQAYPADLSYGQSVFYEIGPFDPSGNGNDNNRPQVAPGTGDFTFDDRGLLQTGTMVTGLGWWGGDDAASSNFAQNAEGGPLVSACYGWTSCANPPVRGIDVGTQTRSSNQTNLTEDFGLNLKWTPSDNMRADFDVQYVKSTVNNYDIEMGLKSLANVKFDLTGSRPRMKFLNPTNVNLSPGNWANPSNYWINYIMDHVEDSSGNELAVKTDFEFDIHKAGIESLKVGVRYASREQKVQWANYNWQNVANEWTDNQYYYFNLDRSDPAPAGAAGDQAGFTGYPTDFYKVGNFSGDWWGLNQKFVFANMDLLQDRKRMVNEMSATSLGFTGGVGWDPICSNTGDRADEIPGTCYRPSELANVTEDTTAAYVRVNFGDDLALFGWPVSGNFGVRVVQTQETSKGGVSFPLLTDSQLECKPNTAQPGQPAPAIPNTVGCYVSADDVAYSNGASRVGETVTTHYNILPSFNVKFDLTDEWLFRVALSRAMSRPDMGNLRNYVGIGARLPSANNPDDPLWQKDGSGNITGATVFYSGSAQNPALAPITADQIDLSLEYYFAEVGSFTTTLFAKQFHNYIQNGKYYRAEENNGVSRTSEIEGPLNGSGARLKGFEVAFQRALDFLPEPFDGLGIQANYTYIDNQSVKNANLSNVGGAGTNITSQAPEAVQVDGLESLSKDSATFVTWYQKGDWEARLAYTWRSEYLVTVVDCCVAYPVWNDATGQLDGSIKYKISDNFTVSLSGNNLLNEVTRTEQQIFDANDGGGRFPTGYFQNDRRFSLGISYTY